MNVNQINKPNEAYESLLKALTDALAGHAKHHQEATEQNAADALRSLANLYEVKTRPPIGTLAENTRGGLIEAYIRIFEEHADFEGFRNRFDYDVPVVVEDGVIKFSPPDNVGIDYSVVDNLFAANDGLIATISRAINRFNLFGDKDVETYEGSSDFEDIELFYDTYRLLDLAYSAIDECPDQD